MRHRKAPGVDPRIAPEQGVSRDGQPLSYNRAPAVELAPWIGRIYITKVLAPADYTLSCGLFNDVACLRVQLAGAWQADTADGPLIAGRSALLFGPQTHRMPIRVTGSFISIGVTVRPGACTALKGPRLTQILDRAVPTGLAGLDENAVLARFAPDGSPEDWACALEDLFRERIAATGAREPDPLTVQFEELAFRSPAMTIAEAARACGVERRRLERTVQRDFGVTPKQVFRRARALDMASQLRGVADRAEAEDIMLRYYDESHLIHEFIQLFGMAPRQFVEAPQPLLTLTLESRQARRLEELDRIAPGAVRPWEVPQD
ncbi:helix-turn-helix domain-containing protein [Novosphingobium sp. 1949]|uniref:Helix-turn-helix domain-containing protein n=2 Tax=Novosphingobium organovorum TaxID=2930092 RepID=A0ABT0B8S7_9SPHN|nr:helix-turn-helix domain-containing protein [Novosphingobium organovorum]